MKNMIIKLDRTAFKQRLWERAFKRAMEQCEFDLTDPSKTEEERTNRSKYYSEKLACYGIKSYGFTKDKESKHLPIEVLEASFEVYSAILNGLHFVTPRQFMQWFPIDKEYDGSKWGMKDYFSTMEYIHEIGIDEPIKEPLGFLWEYWNKDTMNFTLNLTGVMSEIYKQQTGLGIMEEFLLDNGIEPFYE